MRRSAASRSGISRTHVAVDRLEQRRRAGRRRERRGHTAVDRRGFAGAADVIHRDAAVDAADRESPRVPLTTMLPSLIVQRSRRVFFGTRIVKS